MEQKRLVLLLVEDDMAHVELVERAFESSDLDVDIQVSTKLSEARNFLQHTLPDLLLADLNLPDGRGLELLSAADSDIPYPFPLVLITSHGDENIAAEAIKAGAADYVVKSESAFATLPQLTNRVLREWRHINEQKRSLKIFQEVAKGIAIQKDESFCDALARSLSTSLQADKVIIGELAGDKHDRIKTLAFWSDGDKGNNFEYLLKGTPCDLLPTQGLRVFPENVQRLFPEDDLAKQLGVEGYIGVPIRNQQGEPIGVIAALYNTRQDNMEISAPVIQIYANIAAAELERQHYYIEHNHLQQQLRQAQKMEAIGQLTGGIAHDFNNLLASIMGYAELAQNQLDGDPQGKLSEYLLQISNAGNRARDLISKMLIFSREKKSQPEVVNLPLMVNESVDMLRSLLPSTIEFDLQFDDSVTNVEIDPVQLNQIIMNLCLNARDAMQGRGRLGIYVSMNSVNSQCASCRKLFSGDYVVIEIRDTGKGMAPEEAKRIFDPFFTTKDVGKGTGMGLSMVHGIVHEQGGHILLDSTPGNGTVFQLLVLPSHGTATPALNREEQATGPLPHKDSHASILIVDDEEAIAQLNKEVLEVEGYRVTIDTDSEEALRRFMANPQAYDLVITDQTMPKLTGSEMATQMLSLRPDLPIILCTGYSNEISREKAEMLNIQRFLMKPVKLSELKKQVSELLPRPHQV